MKNNLEPDRNLIEIFVDALLRYRGEEGYLSLRVFQHDNKPLFQKMWRAGLNGSGNGGDFQHIVDHAVDMARRAANNPGPAVFCPPLAVFNGAGGWQAREADLLKGLVLSVECDEHPEEARQKLQDILGEATAVVCSGGQWINEDGHAEDKLHLHWRLKSPATNGALPKLKRARELATAIVGGDTSNVPTVHCLRWPGSWHRKGTPRLCELVSFSPDREVDLDEALATLEAAAPDIPNPQEGNDAGAGGRVDLVKLLASMRPGNVHASQVSATAALLERGTKAGAVVDTVLAVTRLAVGEAGAAWNWTKEARDLRDMCETWEKKRGTAPAPLLDPWARCIVPAFPADILPSVVQDFVGAEAAVIGCDPSALSMCTLGTFSGALHHGFSLKVMRRGDWTASPRLWILLRAPVSWKKTPMFKSATSPLVHYEAHLRAKYHTDLREYENVKREAKETNGKCQTEEPKPPPHYVVWDTTVEKLGETLARGDGRKGTLVMADEVAGWLGSMERYKPGKSRSERAFWLKAFDGGPYSMDRVGRGEIFIHNLSVSILGGIQPDRLAEITGLTSDGLLQRFIPTIVALTKFAEDRPSKRDAYDNLVRQLIFVKPVRLIMTENAYAVMENLRRHLHDLEMQCEGGLQGFVGKLPGLAGSLALNLHMADHLANEPKLIGSGVADPVSAQTIENVSRLVLDFIIPHAYEFYCGTGTADGERLQRLASWVLTCGKDRIVASDLTTNVADFRGLGLRDVNDRVSPLVAGGWLLPADNTPVCKSWMVAPQVRIQLAERARSEVERKAEVMRRINLSAEARRGETALRVGRDEPQQSQAAAFATGHDPIDEGVAHRPCSKRGNEAIGAEPPRTQSEPQAEPVKSWYFAGDCPQNWMCSVCGEDGNGTKGKIAKFKPAAPGAPATTLHECCAEGYFERR